MLSFRYLDEQKGVFFFSVLIQCVYIYKTRAWLEFMHACTPTTIVLQLVFDLPGKFKVVPLRAILWTDGLFIICRVYII